VIPNSAAEFERALAAAEVASCLRELALEIAASIRAHFVPHL
jgi:hypothetical protein